MPRSLETAGSVVTVDLGKVRRNVQRVRDHIGPTSDIMYTAKANGYGFGLVPPSLFLRDHCAVRYFSTGLLDEAILLREGGLQEYLLVMGGIPAASVGEFVRNDLAATIYEPGLAELLSTEAGRQNKAVMVHVKINTGLNRFGVRPGDELRRLLDALEPLPNLIIDGIYTHLADGYNPDHRFTGIQMERFGRALEQLREREIQPRLVHVANSAGCVNSPETHFDVVRVAALIFGYDISPAASNRLGLETAMTWHSRVINVLWAEAGENVSYYGHFIPERRTRLAVASFGMADGYLRHLASRDTARNADVLIRGRRGRLLDLTFDQAIIDATDIPDVSIDDMVTIVGRDGGEEITTVELARKAGTSNGHVCCSIGHRPYRQYIDA